MSLRSEKQRRNIFIEMVRDIKRYLSTIESASSVIHKPKVFNELLQTIHDDCYV